MFLPLGSSLSSPYHPFPTPSLLRLLPLISSEPKASGEDERREDDPEPRASDVSKEGMEAVNREKDHKVTDDKVS